LLDQRVFARVIRAGKRNGQREQQPEGNHAQQQDAPL
jgi:hypothetical protein